MCQENNGIFQETFLPVADPKRRKVVSKDENIVETDVDPLETMEVELGVVPCDCSTDHASPLENMEIKVEDTEIEVSVYTKSPC